MKKFALIAGLVTMLAATFANAIASHWILNQPKTPSMLSK